MTIRAITFNGYYENKPLYVCCLTKLETDSLKSHQSLQSCAGFITIENNQILISRPGHEHPSQISLSELYSEILLKSYVAVPGLSLNGFIELVIRLPDPERILANAQVISIVDDFSMGPKRDVALHAFFYSLRNRYLETQEDRIYIKLGYAFQMLSNRGDLEPIPLDQLIDEFYLEETLGVQLPAGDLSKACLRQDDGDLGWKLYSIAMNSLLPRKNTHLPLPIWDGQNKSAKTIVFRRPQGPSDELMYANIFNELSQEHHLIIEVDERMVNLFQRSFPSAEVYPRTNPVHPRLLESDIDAQAPYTAAFTYKRDSATAFPKNVGYIKANPTKVAHIRNQLRLQFGSKKLIGISWRSQNENCPTDVNLEKISPILDADNTAFINLNYLDVADEVERLKTNTGHKIHPPMGIDVYNDIEGLAALISCMDMVITNGNINYVLAGALGKETWVLIPNDWHLFMGQKFDPFFPSVRVFGWSRGQTPDTIVGDLISEFKAKSDTCSSHKTAAFG